jgi:hypothetical protein
LVIGKEQVKADEKYITSIAKGESIEDSNVLEE